jgi:hypothetical protein
MLAFVAIVQICSMYTENSTSLSALSSDYSDMLLLHMEGDLRALRKVRVCGCAYGYMYL